MEVVYSTKPYGHYLQSYYVDEVIQQDGKFMVNSVRYRQDTDRLVELDRHVANPDGYPDLDSAIQAAEASQLSYSQCADEESAAAYEEVSRMERKYLSEPNLDIDPFTSTSGCNTRVTYLYRDLDNRKQHEEIVVAGVLTEEEQHELRDAVEAEGFIPEQVGMRSLKADLQVYGTVGDHPWHELAEISVTEDPTTFPGTAKELLAKFKETDWDPAVDSVSNFDAGLSFGGAR